MLIILSGRPKGGPWHHAPPKYAPGITDIETKSNSLLAALDVRHFQKLRHVFPKLSPKHSYQLLKTALLQHYAPSEDENLKCLLHQTWLTSDITPSQLLPRCYTFTRTRTYSLSFAAAVNVLTPCQQPFTFHFKVLA